MKKTTINLLVAVVSILTVIILLLFREKKEEVRHYRSFSSTPIVCAIDLSVFDGKTRGFVTGYNYELVKRFAKEMDTPVRIHLVRRDEPNYRDSLILDSVNLVIVSIEDTIYNEGTLKSIAADSLAQWTVKDTDPLMAQEINTWLEKYNVSPERDKLHNSYMNIFYNPYILASRGTVRDHLSPYDSLMKVYAKEVAWDWRFIAAICFQESRFHMQARSHKGAEGLMQIMPTTADRYEVEYLFDPEENIRTSVAHLKMLKRMFARFAADEEELRYLTIAAYNAGQGHIFDCINYARSINVDYRVWDSLVPIIPIMSQDTVLTIDTIKFGKFRVEETLKYVENIRNIYDAFTTICHSH